MLITKATRPAAAAAVAGLSILLLSTSSSAGGPCRSVSGHYREHDASGPGCTSPVGLCIAGQYQGDVEGAFAGEATTITGSADTPATATLFFTSNSAITARIGKRAGTLIIKNAGGFHTTPDGAIVDLQTIVGGTGDFTGATGALRAQGTFTTASGGESAYDGTVCVAG